MEPCGTLFQNRFPTVNWWNLKVSYGEIFNVFNLVRKTTTSNPKHLMTVCGYENFAQKSQLLFVFDGDYSDELTRLYTDCNLDLYQKRVSWLDVESKLVGCTLLSSSCQIFYACHGSFMLRILQAADWKPVNLKNYHQSKTKNLGRKTCKSIKR